MEAWLEAGYHGEMEYLETRRDAYQTPGSVLDGAASVMMLGMNYQSQTPKKVGAGQARIARYAWGQSDYHDLIHDRLKHLKRFAQERMPNSNFRGVVDTAPLLEREFAQLAGMGWAAKNTMLISPRHGSWFLLAALLTDTPLEYDVPFTNHHCGTWYSLSRGLSHGCVHCTSNDGCHTLYQLSHDRTPVTHSSTATFTDG